MATGTFEDRASRPPGENLLLTEVRYKVVTTRFGTWKRYLHPSGAVYAAALGQAAIGIAAAGQIGLGLLLGVGQVASGYVAIGQFAVGKYVLAQAGGGLHVWSSASADPEAVRFFRLLKETVFP